MNEEKRMMKAILTPTVPAQPPDHLRPDSTIAPSQEQIVDGRRLQIPEHPRFVYVRSHYTGDFEWHWIDSENNVLPISVLFDCSRHRLERESCCAVAVCAWREVAEKQPRAPVCDSISCAAYDAAEVWEREWRRCQR